MICTNNNMMFGGMSKTNYDINNLDHNNNIDIDLLNNNYNMDRDRDRDSDEDKFLIDGLELN